jgi:NAD(P)-dependent dehydrogenase (short-subunit alcohol dehydrogenase family)
VTQEALKGRVALVTGAGQGIGAAYAARLAELGAHVVVADINCDGATATADALTASGLSASAAGIDVTDADSVGQMVDQIVTDYGSLDVVVNNAAIYQGIRLSPVETTDVDYWRRIIDVNLTGVFIVSRAVIPAMKARGGGVIVNQGSTGSFMNAPNMIHYAVSKAAVVALTRNLASEVGQYNIRVNAIAPGFTLSDATKANFPGADTQANAAAGSALRRNGTPEDILGALEYLTTDASAWVTGQTLVVDGGKVFPR